MPDLNTLQQHPVEGEEYGHLQQHREAATSRVDLLFLVEGHQLLGHFLPVIPIGLFQALHFWLQTAHFCHGTQAGRRKGVEKNFYNNSKQDYRPAPVADKFINKFHGGKNRLGQHPQEAVIHG